MAAAFLETVRTLMQLSSIDEELRICRAELESTLPAMSAAAAAIEALAERLAAVQLLCDAEAKRCSASEADLAAVEKRMARATGRLALLVSAEQVTATEREMAALRGQIGEIEEKVLLAMERMDSLESERAQLDAKLTGMRSDADGNSARWAERAPQLQQRADELTGFRDALTVQLTSEQRRLYSTALRRGAYGASAPAGITLVDGFICRTCHKRLPPMWVNESRVFERLYCCDGCKRILVFDPDGEQAAV